MIVMKQNSQQILLETFESIRGVIDRRFSPNYLVPFDLHKVSKAMLQLYLGPLYWSDDRGSFRRLKRLSELLIEQGIHGGGSRHTNWQLRLLHLVTTLIRKCCFKPKTIPVTKRRRVGGSSFFSAARLNLRNAP
jgi:hypothetical protein